MCYMYVAILTRGIRPKPDELAGRDAAVDALKDAEVGRCSGTYKGYGQIGFSFQVLDEAFAKSEIQRVMHQFFGETEYFVRESD
ncbi:MAG: hypothetical protein WD045_12570 [Pirellulaceae bacterium]